MYQNIHYPLRHLNPLYRETIIDIIRKPDNNEPITTKDVMQSEWVPTSFLLATYQHEYRNQQLMKQAISQF